MITQGKAIWRQPGDTQIYCIASGQGNDEFTVAPYLKNETIHCIKGEIIQSTDLLRSDFFKDFALTERPLVSDTTELDYTNCVNKAVQAIRDKKFEKVVIARQLNIESQVQPEKLFQALIAAYPQAFVYCFQLNNGLTMVGATPETLLERKENALNTQALGGTEQAYGYSEKEYQEHQQIIIDISSKLLAQNYQFKLGKTLPKKAGNVAHLSTAITIDSHSLEQDLNLVNVLHPTAAIGGLPFEPANNFLLANENFNRNYYAGYLGIQHHQNFSFYVNLRCAELYKSGAILFAGAGINSNSIAADEWQETNNKLNTLKQFLN
jgi:isochorismate synthase